LNLWVESACGSLSQAGKAACADVVRTLQSEDQFSTVLACDPGAAAAGDTEPRSVARRIADEVMRGLERGSPLDEVTEATLVALPERTHVPVSILQVLDGGDAGLVECDAPPLFLVQRGQLAFLPVVEDVAHGRLVRRCRFSVGDGDYMAMVSEAYLRMRGRRWGWPEIALAVRRWTDTHCDAGELLGALIRTYRRLSPAASKQDVTVLAMHARPLRTATVWTGPPGDPAQDGAALACLMAERGARVICGNTTAQIAARLLGGTLELEPRPREGWGEVPPVSRIEGLTLVTEGLVTLRKARDRLAGVERVRDLPGSEDGATRLAGVLLAADKIHFVVGLAVNPVQVNESGVPLRRRVVQALARDLRTRGKLVSLEYV
jgi:hypothetical protein